MQLMLRPHEYSSDVGLVPVLAGQSIQQMLRQAAGTDDIVPLSVRVNGYEVPAELWPRLRPKHGTTIHVTPLVLHGSSAKSIIGAIAMIALTYFTFGIGSVVGIGGAYAGTGAYIAAGAMYIAGSMLINALIAPPTPESSTGTEGQWHQLTGSQNRANPWGPIPFVIGEARYFPPHAAMPYTQTIGERSYQYVMMDLGHGDLEVSDIRIGDTPIDDYQQVRWEITRTPTLYQDDVSEEFVNATLEHDNHVPVVRTTAPNVESISLDLIYPQGLFGVGTSGKDFNMSAAWSIQYRPTSGGVWMSPPSPRRSLLSDPPAGNPGANQWTAGVRKTPFGASIAWDVPAGQYEVRVTRIAVARGSSDNTYVDTATWTALRSIRHTDPSTTGTNKLVISIRSNDQVAGTLQTVSCKVGQKIRVYNRNTGVWSAPQVSTNTAWCVYWLMTQCPALSRHVPATRMSLESWADYADFCTLHNLHARMVCDAGTTARELISRIMAGSLGSIGHRDGRYAPVFDHGETLPTETFTPEEISDFRASRLFTVLPNALRVQFVNTDADWQEDEVVVPADGYSYRGRDARGNPSSDPEAETFETLRMEQAMAPQQAWQQARFHLAQALYRPNTFSWDSDIAGLRTVRGDVVDVCHDTAEWGDGFGRVVSIEPGGIAGAAATVTLDQPVVTAAAEQYGMQIRHGDGAVSVVNIVAAGGETAVFAIAPRSGGMPVIRKGDMAVIGTRYAETKKLLITGVRYREELATQFTAVEYDPRVAPYWAGAPASIISEITGRDYGNPDPPELIGVTSSPDNDATDDAGIRGAQIRIGVHKPSRYERDDILVALR